MGFDDSDTGTGEKAERQSVSSVVSSRDENLSLWHPRLGRHNVPAVSYELRGSRGYSPQESHYSYGEQDMRCSVRPSS